MVFSSDFLALVPVWAIAKPGRSPVFGEHSHRQSVSVKATSLSALRSGRVPWWKSVCTRALIRRNCLCPEAWSTWLVRQEPQLDITMCETCGMSEREIYRSVEQQLTRRIRSRLDLARLRATAKVSLILEARQDQWPRFILRNIRIKLTRGAAGQMLVAWMRWPV